MGKINNFNGFNCNIVPNNWDDYETEFNKELTRYTKCIEDSYKYVSSYNEDLDKFIDKWPNIESYFVFYNHMKDSYELNK